MSSECFQPLSCGEVCRILCVDDDPVSQRIVVAALARPGWSVECVCDAQDAIERFADDPRGFDLLVTHHAMAGCEGAGLLRRLRHLGFHGEAILVTTGISPEDATRYRELGIGLMLLKPIEARRLRAATAIALARPGEDARTTLPASAPGNRTGS